MTDNQIENLLQSLGIGHQYCGHRLTVAAMHLVGQDENSLLCVKSGILLPLAEQYHCDWRCIERNLRTVVHRAWRRNAPLLAQIATYPLLNMPTVTEFIDILASHLLRQRASSYPMWS